MREQWRRAAEFYIKYGDQKKAALAAGYSEVFAKKKAFQIFQRQEVKEYIDELHKKMESDAIAKPSEIMKYWTDVMRGESEVEVIVCEGNEIKKILKTPSEQERLKASMQLAKRYGLDHKDEDANKEVMRKLDEVIGKIDVIADE